MEQSGTWLMAPFVCERLLGFVRLMFSNQRVGDSSPFTGSIPVLQLEGGNSTEGGRVFSFANLHYNV